MAVDRWIHVRLVVMVEVSEMPLGMRLTGGFAAK